MKFTSEVIAALETLKIAAENKSEIEMIEDFEEQIKFAVGEIWRDVADYEGLYQVSNKGRVKRIDGKKENFLSLNTDKNNYVRVTVSKNRISKTCLVHRLVALAFIPNPENKPEVNHIDGDKHNNFVENLTWATGSENTQHAFDTGLAKVLRGTQNGAAILTAEQIREIRQIYIKGDKNLGMSGLAKKFNVSRNTIYRILTHQTFRYET